MYLVSRNELICGRRICKGLICWHVSSGMGRYVEVLIHGILWYLIKPAKSFSGRLQTTWPSIVLNNLKACADFNADSPRVITRLEVFCLGGEIWKDSIISIKDDDHDIYNGSFVYKQKQRNHHIRIIERCTLISLERKLK